MSDSRSRSRKAEKIPHVRALGEMSARFAALVFTCFIASFVCSFLCTTFAVRLAGALFLATLFAILNWDIWKTGVVTTISRIIIRSEQPLTFACHVILGLLLEIFMVVGLVIHAVRSLG